MATLTIQQAFALALQHHEAGRLAEAEALYRQILAVQPNHAEALHRLGIIAHQAGQQDIAIKLMRQAIVCDSNNPVTHADLGEVFRVAGHPAEAIAANTRALELAPGYPGAQVNLGNALRDSRRLDEAVAAYRRALELKPDYPEANNNLGVALADQGKHEEALGSLRRAIELFPAYPQAHYNLGNVLRDRGQFHEAVASYRRALELGLHLREVHCNLGNVLRDLGQFDEAIASYRAALQMKPNDPDVLNCLGVALAGQGRLADAITAYRQARVLNLSHTEASSNLIYALYFEPGVNCRAIAEEQQRWNRQFSESLKWDIPTRGHVRDPRRRLRIGYVSPDFREHVIGRNLWPLFRCENHHDFEMVCYSGVVRPDSLTDELRQRADVWRTSVGVSDEALVKMIREDEVDILVDLTQHLAGNRLAIFARQPAPLLVSFAGYPEATGVEAIGYRISDKWLEKGGEVNPDGLQVKTDGHEQAYLIDSFWCYDPCGMDVRVNELPALNAEVLTFGSLNNFCKVNDPLLKLWAQVLKAVKNSRLIVLSHQGSHRQRTLQFLEAEGVEPHRVEFVTPRPRKEYLELYHGLDIALDTFPYNGHTTSLDALWMGVPVVSLCGERPVSRAGLSQLSNLGLPELVAFTEDQYVGIATKLANDIPRLQELRATLRQRMEKSVLMDASHFARQIESCYRSMWRQWCESQKA